MCACAYVCDSVTGGELFEDIVAREFYSEADARYMYACAVFFERDHIVHCVGCPKKLSQFDTHMLHGRIFIIFAVRCIMILRSISMFHSPLPPFGNIISYGDCLEIEKEYYQNCFVYCERATSSMGTVNKNSSYSPVGPWVCLLCFLGCTIYVYVFVCFVLAWSVE